MRDDGNRSLMARAWYGSVRVGVWATLTLGWSLRMRGQTNVPASGPVLLLANHISHIDPAVVGVSCPRRLVYLARHDLFEIPLIGTFIRSVGAVPVVRMMAKEGIHTARSVLEAGHAMLMFPEGTRSPDGTFQPLKPGFTALCRVPGLRILPVGIHGTNVFWPKGSWPRRTCPVWTPRGPAAIAVSFGSPIEAASFPPRDRCSAMTIVADAIVEQIRLAAAFSR